jgi:hypothetical protein
MALKNLYGTLRSHPAGRGLHTWLLLSAISKAKSLYHARPEGKVIFGGRRRFLERCQGKLSDAEWKLCRLSPLVIEGHAKSYGPQGGNHLVSLDATAARLIFHGPDRQDYVLELKLSYRSRCYRRRLEYLQARCEAFRDTPFSVSITEKEVSIAWNAAPALPALGMIADRVLALDLNPNRIGWAVVEKIVGGQCQSIAWGIFEYPELNHTLKLASDDPRTIARNNKRRHEISLPS